MFLVLRKEENKKTNINILNPLGNHFIIFYFILFVSYLKGIKETVLWSKNSFGG